MDIKEVVETIKKAIAEVEWEYPMSYAIAFEKALEALEKQSEIVHCRGCKYWYAFPDDYKTCHNHYEIDGVSKMCGADDFCSFGQRRE